MRKTIWLVVAAAAAVAVYYFQRYGIVQQLAPSQPATAVAEPLLAGMVDDERLANVEPGNWLAYGRDFMGHRFSPLTQVDRDNVAGLGLAWYRDMGTNRTSEATPIVDNGVMYVTSAWSRVYALEVGSGELLWRYDPQVSGEWNRKTCCDVVNRGVAVYRGKVYVGALDGRLHAIDAASGAKIWVVDTITDRTRPYSITGAPLAAAGKIFIGNSGSELGTRGYASAFNAETGELVWRFYTVPGDPSLPFEHPEMELAAKTWTGEWWHVGGGGNVWNAIFYDPEFDQVYLGTGNGAPWARAVRSPEGGDNLFLASIIAVDADTGRMNWYYQEVPGENWDYVATADMALADMQVDGQIRKVLLQAPKNGFFYVLDRATGELLRAHPFVPVTWATHVDLSTGRPVENPETDYRHEPRYVKPSSFGAHNWQPMSLDVDAGLAYLPVVENGFVFALDEEFLATGKVTPRLGSWNLGIELGKVGGILANYPDPLPPDQGYLRAFDPLSGETRWSVPLPHHWNSGVVATAGGLVFQGDATGHVSAYDKDNGERLWRFNAWSSILAPPITFLHEGIQYVSIMTGSGGGALFFGDGNDPDTWASSKYGNIDRLLVFRLGGDEELPRPTLVDRTIPPQDLGGASEETIARGEDAYMNHCATCHGMHVRSSLAVPDLRRMQASTHELFGEIVLDGLYLSNGMASFADVLNERDVEDIHSYIRARAEEDRLAAAGEKEAARLTWVD